MEAIKLIKGYYHINQNEKDSAIEKYEYK